MAIQAICDDDRDTLTERLDREFRMRGLSFEQWALEHGTTVLGLVAALEGFGQLPPEVLWALEETLGATVRALAWGAA